MTEEIRTELAQLADRLVDHTARANLIRAQLREEEERLERIVQRTRIHQRIEKLRQQAAEQEEAAKELDAQAKCMALSLYEQAEDKHPHDLISIQERTSLEFLDENMVYGYGAEHAPDLMITKPKNLSSFKKWIKAQMEADRDLLDWVEVRVNVTTAFSHKAFAELTEARAFEIVQKEQEEAAEQEDELDQLVIVLSKP